MKSRLNARQKIVEEMKWILRSLPMLGLCFLFSLKYVPWTKGAPAILLLLATIAWAVAEFLLFDKMTPIYRRLSIFIKNALWLSSAVYMLFVVLQAYSDYKERRNGSVTILNPSQPAKPAFDALTPCSRV